VVFTGAELTDGLMVDEEGTRGQREVLRSAST
jgi:hypothetical protein